jgi:regulatory protein
MPRPTREPPKRSAKSYALWLLSRREYAAKELLTTLTNRGYPQDEAETAVTSMQGYGFQDDNRYAEMKARASSRRSGNRRVTMVLVEKGVSKELAAQQLDELEPEPERALRLVQKFEGKPLDEALKGKVWRFLAYRGFSTDAIKASLGHLKAHEAAEHLEDNE